MSWLQNVADFVAIDQTVYRLCRQGISVDVISDIKRLIGWLMVDSVLNFDQALTGAQEVWDFTVCLYDEETARKMFESVGAQGFLRDIK